MILKELRMTNVNVIVTNDLNLYFMQNKAQENDLAVVLSTAMDTNNTGWVF